jgi:hypothetical protein
LAAFSAAFLVQCIFGGWLKHAALMKSSGKASYGTAAEITSLAVISNAVNTFPLLNDFTAS